MGKVIIKRSGRIIGLVVVCVILLFTGTPVYAQMPKPDDTFQITQIECYRSVLETNDQLYLISGTIEYNTPPTNYDVSESFIVRLMDAGVEIGTTTFYYDIIPSYGYAQGICSIYYSAATAPAWLGAYDVYIDGNPTLQWFDTTATTAMQGAVADDGGAQTDETAESNSVAANDMTLLPAVPAVGDAYYFGSTGMFDRLTVNVGQNGSWTGTYAWEYWIGTSWVALTGLADDSIGFTVGTGNRDISWTCPDNWQTSVVDGINAYWVRFRVATYTAIVTQPLGTQSWVSTSAALPSINSNTIQWIDEGSVSATSIRLTTRLRYIAEQLEGWWGGTTDLINDSASGKKLTSDGETYFTNSINNLREMCPDLFSASLAAPDFGEKAMIDDGYYISDDSDLDMENGTWYAQTFTASRAYNINGVWVKVFRVGNPGTQTISLRETDPITFMPTGADLVSGTLNANDYDTSTSGEWEWLTFTDDYTLTTGTLYALVARVTGVAPNTASWRVDTAGTYADGQACVSATAGVNWAVVANNDFMFMVTATEGYSLSLRNRLASRLIGTMFDMTNLGTHLGLSRMWATFFVYLLAVIMITAAFIMYAVKAFKPGVTSFVFCLLMVLGAPTGFVYLEVGILFTIGFIGAAIWAVLYDRS